MLGRIYAHSSPEIRDLFQFFSSNIYLVAMGVTIWSSARQHLSANDRSEPLSAVDYTNFAIIPVTAIANIIGIGFRVYDKISSISETLNGAAVTNNSNNEAGQAVISSTRRNADMHREQADLIFLETLITQIALAIGLGFIRGYTYDNTKGLGRFIIETVFYILETTSYGVNLNALAERLARCEEIDKDFSVQQRGVAVTENHGSPSVISYRRQSLFQNVANVRSSLFASASLNNVAPEQLNPNADSAPDRESLDEVNSFRINLPPT